MSKNTNKKQQKKPATQEQKYLELEAVITQETSDEVTDQIFKILDKTPFNKISFPLSTYRQYLEDGVPEDDTRVTTIGYIKKYDSASKKFTVIVFSNFMATIKAYENPMVEVKFIESNGKLACITKLNVVPTEAAEVDEDPVDDVEEGTSEESSIDD